MLLLVETAAFVFIFVFCTTVTSENVKYVKYSQQQGKSRNNIYKIILINDTIYVGMPNILATNEKERMMPPFSIVLKLIMGILFLFSLFSF